MLVFMNAKRDSLRYSTVVTVDGGTVFKDSEITLAEQHIVAGVPPMFLGALPSAAGMAFVRSATIGGTWHPAPRKQWVVMVRGVIEVAVTDGTRRRFGPGDLLLVTDTTGRGHHTAGIGEGPFEALYIPVP